MSTRWSTSHGRRVGNAGPVPGKPVGHRGRSGLENEHMTQTQYTIQYPSITIRTTNPETAEAESRAGATVTATMGRGK